MSIDVAPMADLSKLTEIRTPATDPEILYGQNFADGHVQVRLPIPGDERYLLAWLQGMDPASIAEGTPGLIGHRGAILASYAMDDSQMFICEHNDAVTLCVEVNLAQEISGIYTDGVKIPVLSLFCDGVPPIATCAQALVAACTYFFEFADIDNLYVWVYNSELAMIEILVAAGFKEFIRLERDSAIAIIYHCERDK